MEELAMLILTFLLHHGTNNYKSMDGTYVSQQLTVKSMKIMFTLDKSFMHLFHSRTSFIFY